MRVIQTILFLLISSYNIAQVQENLLLERNYMNAFNPAFVGSEGKEFGLVNRSNWENISNSPKTSYLFYSGETKKKLTLGLSAITNKIFIDRRTLFAIDASYMLEISNSYKLYLGLKTGFSTKTSDVSLLERITNEINPYINNNKQASYPILGIGFLLKSDKMFFSLGTANILNPSNFINDQAFILYETPVLYNVFGITYKLNNNGFLIKPFISIKYIQRMKNRINFGGIINYKDRIEIGGGYTSDNFTYATICIKSKSGISIGISSDFNVTHYHNIFGGGSEVFLRYSFNKRQVKIENESISISDEN